MARRHGGTKFRARLDSTCHPHPPPAKMSFDAEGHERPRKRTKKESNGPLHESRRLFAPFRALGFVTNHVPFAIQVRTYKGATTAPRVHILTCLGRAWAELEGEKMRLLFVGVHFLLRFSIGNLSFSTDRSGYQRTYICFIFAWKLCLGDCWPQRSPV